MMKQFGNRFPVTSDNHDFECWCYTKDKKVKGRFVWKIDDFTYRTEMLKSSVFPSSAPNSREWSLWLYPKGNDESNKSHVSLFIYHESSKEIWATVKFSLINDKGTVARSAVTQCYKFTHKSNTGFPRFVERGYVLNKDNGVLPNDELTIVCDIEMRHGPENRYREFVPAKFEPPLCRLAEDMGNLLSSKSLTDVTITVGDRQFSAHKAILAARSPVFAAMFRNEMVEKKFSAVKITDIDPDVFQEMLEYMYTGNEISQSSRTKELLAAANKYELDRLKFMCEEAICKVLSVDNVLENIALADYYNASYLKEYAFSFLMKNSSDVIGSSSWNKFKRTHQSLLAEMFQKLCM